MSQALYRRWWLKEQFKHHWQMKNGRKIARSTINSNSEEQHSRQAAFASMQSSVSKCVFCWVLCLWIDDITLTSCLCCFLLASHHQTLKPTTPVLNGDEEPIWSPTSATTVTINEDDSTPTKATASMPI